MPRINVDDDLFTDRRWTKLVLSFGNEYTAMGALFFVWKKAQEYWVTTGNGIPLPVWESQEFSSKVIESGFAKIEGDFVCIVNPEKHFGWLKKRINAGKKGGMASAQSRKRGVEIIEENFKQSLSKPKQTQPSSSSSSSVLKNTYVENNPSAKASGVCTPTGVNKPSDQELEQVYKEYPRKEGKLKGFKKLRKVAKTHEDLQKVLAAIRNYKSKRANVEPRYIKTFDTFMGCWEEWLDPTTGTVDPIKPTKRVLNFTEGGV